MKEPENAIEQSSFQKEFIFYIANNRKAWDTMVYRELNCVHVWGWGGKCKKKY